MKNFGHKKSTPNACRPGVLSETNNQESQSLESESTARVTVVMPRWLDVMFALITVSLFIGIVMVGVTVD